MIIRRFVTALRQQDWGLAVLDFLIVVAGIFVGLQVDDWNQLRKDKIASLDTLMAIRAELEDQRESYELMRYMANTVIDGIEFLESTTAQPSAAADDPARLLQTLLLTEATPVFAVPTRVYERALASNDLDYVSDQKLLLALKRHRIVIDGFAALFTTHQTTREEFAKAIAGSITLSQHRAFGEFEGDLFVEGPSFSDFESDDAVELAQQLASNKGFSTWLPGLLNYNYTARGYAVRQLSQIDNIQTLIDIELRAE